MVRFLAACAVALACLSPASAQDKRVALVIGNATYAHGATIKTALNDAADIGAALGRMGFAVTRVNDATRAAMERALADFRVKANTADVAIVFYGGQAIQADGVNWLIPVDGRFDTLAGTIGSAVSLDGVIDAMAGTGQFGIVLLDAARNNPFPAPKQSAPRQTVSKQNAPKAVLPAAGGAPKEILMAFATGTGRTPVDTGARNSAFTAALLKYIETPQLELGKLMSLVRDAVFRETGKKQIPSTYATLTSDRYLMPR